MQLEDLAMACAPKHVRSSSAHEFGAPPVVAFCMTEDHLLSPEVRSGKTNTKSFGNCSSPPAGPQIPFKVKLFALQAGSVTSLNAMEVSTGTSRTERWLTRFWCMLPRGYRSPNLC
jgi:hypothetical protein